MNKDRKGAKVTYKQPEMVAVPNTGGLPRKRCKNRRRSNTW